MSDDPMEAGTWRELWHSPVPKGGDVFYSDSVWLTESGAIAMNCGGTVVVRRVREWISLAWPDEERRRESPTPKE